MKVSESLKARLGIGAALLGGVTLILAAVLYLGMTRVSDRLEAALERLERRLWLAVYGVVAAILVQAFQPILAALP